MNRAQVGTAGGERHWPSRAFGSVVAGVALLVGAIPEKEATAEKQAAGPEARAAAARGLAWVTHEGVAWVQREKCASCHHAPMMVWALQTAREAGFSVDEAALGQVKRYAVESYLRQGFTPVPGLDTAPLSLGALNVALSPSARPPSTEEMRPFRDHLRETQLADGSWAVPDLLAPDLSAGRRPPLYDTREVTTRWAVLALAAPQPDEERERSDAAIRDALAWLDGSRDDSAPETQALVLRVLTAFHVASQKPRLRTARRELLRRQNPDGGWGQHVDAPSDAFATGQALYALGTTGMTGGDAAIRRAWHHLARTQLANGSWSVPSRTQDLSAIATSFCGTAWAVMGIAGTTRPPH